MQHTHHTHAGSNSRFPSTSQGGCGGRVPCLLYAAAGVVRCKCTATAATCIRVHLAESWWLLLTLLLICSCCLDGAVGSGGCELCVFVAAVLVLEFCSARFGCCCCCWCWCRGSVLRVVEYWRGLRSLVSYLLAAGAACLRFCRWHGGWTGEAGAVGRAWRLRGAQPRCLPWQCACTAVASPLLGCASEAVLLIRHIATLIGKCEGTRVHRPVMAVVCFVTGHTDGSPLSSCCPACALAHCGDCSCSCHLWN